MTADIALTLSGLLLESVLVVLLIGRRVHRTLPTFLGYIVVALSTDALASLVPSLIGRDLYLYCWIASLVLEFACGLGLIMELGRNLLRHNRIASPNWFLALVLFVPVVWVLTLLSRWTIPPRLPVIWHVDLRLSQGTAIVGLGAFLALAWWSALRRLRNWPGSVGCGCSSHDSHAPARGPRLSLGRYFGICRLSRCPDLLGAVF